MSVRFAPSPTGTFHVGNFRTAWISHWWAKSLSLPWIVRFEDIDRPRIVKGAQEKQTAEMLKLGLRADRILLQSENLKRHHDVFARFYGEGLLYPCFCSRKTIRASLEKIASAPHEKIPTYNGACRRLKQHPKTVLPTLAWRLKMPDESGCDDFIVARTSPHLLGKALPPLESFVPAYTWACAIDDFDECHALLIRAWDLDEMTAPQRAIQGILAGLENSSFNPPAVFHTSLITQNDGSRLEKRTRGVTMEELIASGETPNSLREKFAASFVNKAAEYEKSKIWGEARRTLGCSEIIKGIPA